MRSFATAGIAGVQIEILQKTRHPFDDQAVDFMRFNSICAVLDLDRRLVRRAILKWQHSGDMKGRLTRLSL